MAATTRISTDTDFAVSAILQNLAAFDAILLACDVLGKVPSDYDHLDAGRRKMTAGNLLRGAARHDAGIVAKLQEARKQFQDDPRIAKKAEKRAAKKAAKANGTTATPVKAAAPVIDWTGKSARFQFATIVDGEPKFWYKTPKNFEGEVFSRPQ